MEMVRIESSRHERTLAKRQSYSSHAPLSVLGHRGLHFRFFHLTVLVVIKLTEFRDRLLARFQRFLVHLRLLFGPTNPDMISSPRSFQEAASEQAYHRRSAA